MKKCAWLCVPLLVSVVMFTGCGKGNIFSWAHSAGDTKNLDSMNSDASAALQAKDYVKALDYYTKLIAADPSNSEAIYGYAVAELANSGLDVGDLIANLIKQQNSNTPEYRNLAPAIATLAARSSSSSQNLLPQSIIDNIVKLKNAINAVLDMSKLPKIILGRADSRISPDNVDVNINVAFCLLLRAAMTVETVIKFDTDYNATVITTDKVALQTAAVSALKDIASAYARFNVVVKALNISGDNSIVKIRGNISDLFNSAQTALRGQGIDCSGVKLDTDYLSQQ